MLPAQREHSSDLSHTPSPILAEWRRGHWVGGAWGTSSGCLHVMAEPAIGDGGRVLRLWACCTTGKIFLGAPFISLFSLIEKVAYLATVAPNVLQTMLHIAIWQAVKAILIRVLTKTILKMLLWLVYFILTLKKKNQVSSVPLILGKCWPSSYVLQVFWCIY